VNLNDENPVFDQPTYNFTVPEAFPLNTPFGQVRATDPDNLDSIRYIVQGSNSFRAIPNTGELVLVVTLDFETLAFYQFTVEAVEEDQTSIGVANIYITVEDSNDHPPQFVGGPFAFSIRENVPTGEVIGVVNASDADAGLNEQVTFSTFSPFFDINPSTGEVYNLVPLDREANASVNITVVASDQGDPPLNATTVVLVSILDVNDNAPEFLETLPSNFSIRENATAGTFIGTLVALDSDDPASPNSDVSYTIVDGSGMGVFDLNPNSGYLTVSSALNFENTSQYDLVIAASDDGSPSLNSTRSFTIYIVDVDDNTPLFVQKTYQFEITENNLPGAFVGQVMANDLDPHNRAIGYEFTAPSTLFSLDRDNGTIFALVTFNREVVRS